MANALSAARAIEHREWLFAHPYAIRAKATRDSEDWFFEKTFDNRLDFHQFRETYCNSKPRIGFFESLVITVRTDTLRNFCEDFFLPTFIHHVMRTTDDIAIKILRGFICLILDICTLPIRIITLPLRYYANAQSPRESHPLHRYLAAQEGIDPSLLNTNSVYLEIKESTDTAKTVLVLTEDGTPLETDDKHRQLPLAIEFTFDFIDLPQKGRSSGVSVLGPPNAVFNGFSMGSTRSFETRLSGLQEIALSILSDLSTRLHNLRA